MKVPPTSPLWGASTAIRLLLQVRFCGREKGASDAEPTPLPTFGETVQAPKGGKSGVSILPDLPPFSRVKSSGESGQGGRTIKRSARRCNARRVQRSEKVEREALLVDAALKLGYPNLTKKVRRALNKALSVANNAGRLRTDWERVWHPKKR
jgi:hypothetical protein